MINRQRAVFIIVLGFIILVLGAVTFTYVDFGNKKPSVAEQLQPNGTLPFTDLEGELLDLSAYEGKPIIINSWATWHPFSKEELTDLNQLASEYEDEDVVVIAVNRGEAEGTVKGYIEKVLNSPEHIVFVQDPGDTYYDSIGGFSMPESIFYDEDGNIVEHAHGEMSYEKMKANLEKTLNPEP